MKKNTLLAAAVFVFGTYLPAQEVTNAPPAAAIPAAPVTNAPAPDPASTAPATNAPAAKAEKKTTPKKKAGKKSASTKKAAPLRTIPLVAGQATVVASNVNLRAQAKLKSEVIAQLQKGQVVNVLEEVTLKNSGPSEPSAWAKIVLPASVHVWVNTSFISSNKTVVPKRLKMRGGPSEAYSVVGIIKQGEEVKEVGTKGEWTEIEAPAEAAGFVAAQYLSQEPSAAPVVAASEIPAVAPATTPEPAPAPTVVTENPPVAPATNEPVVVPATNEPPANAPEVAATEPVAISTNAPLSETNVVEELPPRIVEREGFVQGTFSVQAPTRFQLVSPDTRRVINYLYTTNGTEVDLRRFKGMHIVVTGEEGLDERWRNTPVITVQQIHVVE